MVWNWENAADNCYQHFGDRLLFDNRLETLSDEISESAGGCQHSIKREFIRQDHNMYIDAFSFEGDDDETP